jgi:hypothetical protein
MRSVELTLNDTGFLCNMMQQAFEGSGLPRAPDGRPIIPLALHELYVKLATANDEMMTEEGHAQVQ